MSALEIFVDRNALTDHEQEERKIWKVLEHCPDEELCDDDFVLIDINLYLDQTVPLNGLGSLAKAIGVELRDGQIVEDAPSTKNGLPCSVIVMAFELYAPTNLTDNEIQQRALSIAIDAILPFEKDEFDPPIEYPYETKDFCLYLARDARMNTGLEDGFCRCTIKGEIH
ncbi:hypothetical protein P170DRAFT_425672 [Aspergillus steynii IBT 23096]|uniref:Uncharacterized protein n=1 Tax=Aspergillus steynii IBT 23096 TaxID=1392250 RepID=A0A2I2G6Y3_9EURO|nr:uncharacterized protein P170DRAFT_425672 [Aspergillus steynii IBT 23096]PLB48634.1 hypothetical protein P170DRAFT_425672 [Aspergillus steynii IBT 23096]